MGANSKYGVQPWEEAWSYVIGLFLSKKLEFRSFEDPSKRAKQIDMTAAG